MAEKVNHHFVPQFYLRGFAEGLGRRARIFVFDSDTRKAFKTSVRNVGSKRNFNRIEAEGFDPNHVEDALSIAESDLAKILSETVESRTFLSSEHRESLMYFAGLLAVRTPERRAHFDGLKKQIIERISHMLFTNEEIWNSQMTKMAADGVPIDSDITFQEMKKFHEEGRYELIIDQTNSIGHEFKMAEEVSELLSKRNWSFVYHQSESQFITSNNPLVLSWKAEVKETIYSPGFGLQETIVTLPLSSQVMLMGTFEEMPSLIEYDAKRVTNANTHAARHSTKQIFARDGLFRLDLRDRTDVQGRDLPKLYGR